MDSQKEHLYLVINEIIFLNTLFNKHIYDILIQGKGQKQAYLPWINYIKKK